MTLLSLCLPYYDNPTMLALQYEAWAAWPDELKAKVEIILVDDGSPNSPAYDVLRPAGLPRIAIYRVKEDIPWHQHGARNLAAHMAHGRWLLLTDMDHQLPQSSAEAIILRAENGRLVEDMVYMLDRIEADTGKPTIGDKGQYKPHPNSFVMTKAIYWRIGGYDEEYCGHYGTDSFFKQRAFAVGRRGHLLGIPLRRYWRELVPDASTTTLPRKEGDRTGLARVREAKMRSGVNEIQALRFDWFQQL